MQWRKILLVIGLFLLASFVLVFVYIQYVSNFGLKDGECGIFTVTDKIRLTEKVYKDKIFTVDVTWPHLKFEDKYGIPLYLRISEDGFDDLDFIKIGDLTNICRYGDEVYFQIFNFL